MHGRWIVIVAGLLTLLGLGSIYSWSVFRSGLEEALDLSATQSILPYTLALVFYAMLMPVAGFFIDRTGPRKILWAGALLVAAGCVTASLAQSGWTLALGYGVLAGSGVGIAYGVPLAVSARWFPEARGLVIGITVIGFGISPLVTAPTANFLIETFGVRAALVWMGAGIFSLLALCSIWMRFPVEKKPSVEENADALPAARTLRRSTVFSTLLNQRAFYGLWICFALGTFIGLSAIGISVSVGLEVFALAPGAAAGFLALFAVFNGASRPLFGWLTDRFQPWGVVCFLFAIVIAASVLLAVFHPHGTPVFVVGFCLLWFSLGGWLALAPTATMKLFPAADYARNYGIMFTAYGVGAFFGTLLTGFLRDSFGNYLPVFPLLALMALLGISCAFTLLRERNRWRAPRARVASQAALCLCCPML